MVVLNAALLSILLPAAVLARPNQHEKLHHKRHGHGEGYYPTSNSSTTAVPTATAPGLSSVPSVVTISSIIEVIPLPVTSSGQVGVPTGSPEGPGGPSGPGAPGESGKPGTPGTPGKPEKPNQPGNEDQCGPATVTVTSAKTVTVTVPAAGGQKSSPPEHPAAPAEHQPTPESKPKEKAHQPQPQEHPTSQAEQSKPKPAPEANASPAKETKPEHPVEQKHAQPAKQAPAHEQPAPVAEHPAPKPKTEEKHESPAKPVKHEQPAKPAPESKPPVKEEKETEKPSGEKKSGPGARGLLYKDIKNADAMAGHISWGANWDSSPIPAIGHASGSLTKGIEWVPQLWGPDELHTSLWAANSKGANYVMAFNEPNQPREHGGCGPIGPSDAVAPYEKFLGPNKKAGQKIISPCVSNEAHQWLDDFLSATSLKPDAVCFHWYGLNQKELEGVVKTFAGLQSKHGIPELWLTEWALNADLPASDAKKLLNYLENESGVNRHAYNNEKLPSAPGMKSAYCPNSS